MKKASELERQLSKIEWDQNYSKARGSSTTVNNSVEFRSIDHSGIQSSKSMQKN